MVDVAVPDALDGERLDRIVAMLGDCSRSKAADMISSGAVRLDGSPATQRSVKVTAGAAISFELPAPVEKTVLPDESIGFGVVFADDDIVVVDKPAGLVVHPGAGRPDNTLANGLLHRFPEIAVIGDPARPGIVHRLDADTSGLLVVARSEPAYDRLSEMMAHHVADRIYLAVVTGHVSDDRGLIDAPIGRASRNRTKMAVTEEGREARTHYEVLDRSTTTYESKVHELSLVRCRLDTGRTHQIRVHLAAIGHPVLADHVYGARAGSSLIDRVALHAHRLQFDHPISDEALAFQADPPPDLQALFSLVGLSQ